MSDELPLLVERRQGKNEGADVCAGHLVGANCRTCLSAYLHARRARVARPNEELREHRGVRADAHEQVRVDVFITRELGANQTGSSHKIHIPVATHKEDVAWAES